MSSLSLRDIRHIIYVLTACYATCAECLNLGVRWHLRRMHRFDQSIRALGLYAVEIAGSGMISRQVWRISGHSGREPSRIPIYNGIGPRRIGQKQACRAFPDHQRGGIASGPERHFQILSLLDFLAEFTQHIPAKGSHPIRYHGSCCFPVEFTISSL